MHEMMHDLVEGGGSNSSEACPRMAKTHAFNEHGVYGVRDSKAAAAQLELKATCELLPILTRFDANNGAHGARQMDTLTTALNARLQTGAGANRSMKPNPSYSIGLRGEHRVETKLLP
jgi:carbamate kinase